MDIPILYEDESVAVIDKPSGVVVWDEARKNAWTIRDWAKEKVISRKSSVTSENEDFNSRAGIVHRLDKETSGCLIIAKNPESFEKLKFAFKNRLVSKIYIALVHGKVLPDKGEVRAPLGRMPGKKWKFSVIPGGKEAITKYKVLKHLSEKFSLVELNPVTGRTHQIRIHLKYLGFSVVGDYLYGLKNQKKEDRSWCPRVFLHASKITFPHPALNRNVTVESKVPSQLQTVLETIALRKLRYK